jgi:adenine/guanine phosphoribosyltransferase-like PRPP-binding protein
MSGLNLLVFRGDQRRVRGKDLKAALTAQLEQLGSHGSQQALLGALLLAGELECGIADAYPEAASSCERLTDQLADALFIGEPTASINPNFQKPDFVSLIDAARALPTCDQLSISTPEGFAYYALHPLAYADVIRQIPAFHGLLVVGIRSIGTTLSAVTAVAACARGIVAKRFTVRPQGHPYNRTAEFTAEQMTAVRNAVSCGANFAVVDEGPGSSGSSFLAVAEALEQAGAPLEKIVLVSGHAPNLDALCAENAARRWQRLRCIPVAGEARRPAEAVDFIGGGQWRSGMFASESEWPASWTGFERLKYLSSAAHDERRFFKFAGLGHYGEAVLEREQKVAAAGFGLMPRAESDGFISYSYINGRPLAASDLSLRILARMAEYCAFRVRAFAVELANHTALQQMADHNLHELGLDSVVELHVERPVIADGRMQPHEWLLGGEGDLLKTDSGSHGDDHLFPGPTDIAWDLAGAIVEWQMNDQQMTEFLNLYHRASGDDASARIDGFIKAYVVFRCAYCLMAANAMSGQDELLRLQNAADVYRAVLTEPRASRAVLPSSLFAAIP